MTQKEQIKYLLRKKPELKYNRGEFMWAWIEEMFGVNIGITRSQFLEFWENEATIERSLRELLKDPEFRLEPQADQRRYEKAAEIKQEFKPKDPQERKDYNFVFGENKL